MVTSSVEIDRQYQQSLVKFAERMRNIDKLGVHSMRESKRLLAVSFAVMILTGCTQSEQSDVKMSPEKTVAADALAVEKIPKNGLRAKSFIILNEDKPGASVDVEQYLVPGKTTVVCYFSSRVESVVKAKEMLQELAQSRSDLALRLVDIDRPGGHPDDLQSDFESPAANQIKKEGGVRVPDFRIYDSAQRLQTEGVEALNQVQKWMNKPRSTRRDTR